MIAAMRWDRKIREIIFSNWREKLVALVIAFFFWYLVRAQIRETALRYRPDFDTPRSLRSDVELH